MKIQKLLPLFLAGAILVSCSDDDEENQNPTPGLTIPSEYLSPNYAQNVATEAAVMNSLAEMTAAANAAEANAQSGTPINAIEYPSNLSGLTNPSYRNFVEDWLVELVNSANSPDGFQNPGIGGSPDENQEGGLLGLRLLDEYGLELEQMVEKGSFGAACYNHALTIINTDVSGGVSSADIDKLVEIHGTEITFDAASTRSAATYSRRRSNLDNQTGFFYDIRTNLITAKAAIEAGSAFNNQRDQALQEYLLNWEKSNFATVIYYCNATKVLLQEASALPEGNQREEALGDAMHAYAEGVGFTHGFKGLFQKQITDAEIDGILALFLAPAGFTPESHRFLNEVSLLANLDQAIDEIQAIYGFTDEEVAGFYINNNP